MTNPLTNRLWLVVVLLAVGSLVVGCGSTATTNYNIYIQPDSISYADSVTIEPGQGGDATDSSTLAASSQGGEGLSPGNNIVNRGLCDYGVIFNIGTETPATSTTTATTDATANLDAAAIP